MYGGGLMYRRGEGEELEFTVLFDSKNDGGGGGRRSF